MRVQYVIEATVTLIPYVHINSHIIKRRISSVKWKDAKNPFQAQVR